MHSNFVIVVQIYCAASICMQYALYSAIQNTLGGVLRNSAMQVPYRDAYACNMHCIRRSRTAQRESVMGSVPHHEIRYHKPLYNIVAVIIKQACSKGGGIHCRHHSCTNFVLDYEHILVPGPPIPSSLISIPPLPLKA